MPTVLWALGAISGAAFGVIAYWALDSFPIFIGYAFSGVASLVVFGWMAQILRNSNRTVTLMEQIAVEMKKPAAKTMAPAGSPNPPRRSNASDDLKTCPNCYAVLKPGAEACSRCGKAVDVAVAYTASGAARSDDGGGDGSRA